VNTIFDFPIEPLIIKRYTWLWIKFYWYKWILRRNIIGFFAGIPIIGSENIEEDLCIKY